MEKITLEKIDIIRERTGVSYSEAKEALEICDGNVVEALVHLEEKIKNTSKDKINEIVTTKEELKKWLNDLVQKGNVTRIRIKKGEKVIVDIPVNAGIAAGILSMAFPPAIGLGVIAAIATKVTIEITKDDGSVEVINTIIQGAVDEAKSKVNEVRNDFKKKFTSRNDNFRNNEEKTYSYTVNFDEEECGEVKTEPIEHTNDCCCSEKINSCDCNESNEEDK